MSILYVGLIQIPCHLPVENSIGPVHQDFKMAEALTLEKAERLMAFYDLPYRPNFHVVERELIIKKDQSTISDLRDLYAQFTSDIKHCENGKMEWEELYQRTFPGYMLTICEAKQDLDLQLDYYDPDTSYEEDIKAVHKHVQEIIAHAESN